MARVYLVRHGRATGGWDIDPDPGLDPLGQAQADALVARLTARLGPGTVLPIVTSPMRRCRETAWPLAQHWRVTATVVPALTEIPSPSGVPMGERTGWLRRAMAGTYGALGERYTSYRDDAVAHIGGLVDDTVVVSHFVAINAVIGACLDDDRLVIRSLDNTSITVVETSAGAVRLVEGGHEADTLIR